MDVEILKREAALAALAFIPQEGIVGLGTGSTARHAIVEIGRRVRAGARLSGVPTSESSRSLALAEGIPLLPDEGPWAIDVTIDGADEVDASQNLIKGGGGALLREKIVNAASRLRVIVVDASKLSTRLGERFPVPVEVVPFGHAATARRLATLGRTALRPSRSGEAFRTDGGNVIYDVTTGPISDPAELEETFRRIPGVVDTGLFVGRADRVVVADPSGVRVLGG